MEVDGSNDFPFLNWSFLELSALHFQGNRLGGFLVCWGVAMESETTPLKSPKEFKILFQASIFRGESFYIKGRDIPWGHLAAH